MLWQHFGQAAWGVDQDTIMILLFEKKYLALDIMPNTGQTGPEKKVKKVNIGQKHKVASQLQVTAGTQKQVTSTPSISGSATTPVGIAVKVPLPDDKPEELSEAVKIKQKKIEYMHQVFGGGLVCLDRYCQQFPH